MIDIEDVKIRLYREEYKSQIISVWEKSVRATHDFLLPSDISYYKKIIGDIDFGSIDTYCLMLADEVLGFIGIVDNKIEMLFLSPDIIGFGFGKKLIKFAIEELGANLVDVNEQNINAVRFYEKCGFAVYDRLAKDSEGKNYPILKMRLK